MKYKLSIKYVEAVYYSLFSTFHLTEYMNTRNLYNKNGRQLDSVLIPRNLLNVYSLNLLAYLSFGSP